MQYVVVCTYLQKMYCILTIHDSQVPNQQCFWQKKKSDQFVLLCHTKRRCTIIFSIPDQTAVSKQEPATCFNLLPFFAVGGFLPLERRCKSTRCAILRLVRVYRFADDTDLNLSSRQHHKSRQICQAFTDTTKKKKEEETFSPSSNFFSQWNYYSQGP